MRFHFFHIHIFISDLVWQPRVERRFSALSQTHLLAVEFLTDIQNISCCSLLYNMDHAAFSCTFTWKQWVLAWGMKSVPHLKHQQQHRKPLTVTPGASELCWGCYRVFFSTFTWRVSSRLVLHVRTWRAHEHRGICIMCCSGTISFHYQGSILSL